MENISRRNFMKGVGAVALVTAATGLLSGCGDDGLIVDANGLNDTAELKGVKMTVRRLSYAAYNDGTYYFVPEVLINNNSAAGIPLKPAGGSFELWLNGSTKLNISDETMARLDSSKDFTRMDSRTLSRGQYEKGSLCGKGTGVSSFNYLYVIFYPNPEDQKTALRCKISAKEAKVLLGI